ncbi:MAG: hypothetical protein RBU29_00980 [bacterium]|jgi:hypothetical protein|nr:hypothetical protein [bacterium]
MNSKTRRVLGVTVCLVLALAFGASQSTLWSQEDNAPAPVSKVGVDMQILSFENKGELQAYMKSASEALGVGCKFCHDITAFEKNPEGLHKGAARGMMKMMN